MDKQQIIAVEETKDATNIGSSAPKEKPKKNSASLALNCVRENWQLFRDSNRNVYGQHKMTGEIYAIKDEMFIDSLAASLYRQKAIIINDHAKKSILQVLQGEGLYNSPCYEVFLRVALHEGRYYIDLGEAGNSRAIEINMGEWRVIEKPPIRFVRSSSMRSLPEPVACQDSQYDLSCLWRLVNIPDAVKLLVLTWLLECFRPETPYPVLEIIGEQGSAKSTTQKILRQLVDPNIVNLRGAPKSCDDMAVATQENHIVSYENLSHLTQDMQDMLCIISTGAGHAKRQLYSDKKELILKCKNPIMINGINEVVTSQDLVSRTVSIELPTIEHRQEVNFIDDTFKECHGEILGALLNLFARAIKLLPDIQLPEDEQPRLIEFVKFGMAVAGALGYEKEDFLKQYRDMNRGSIERALDASPVAVAILEFISNGCPNGFRRLSMRDFFSDVTKYKPPTVFSQSWPHSPRGFSNALRRIMPALKIQGIHIKKLGKIGGHSMIEITDKRGAAERTS